jgi:hypothetical protein
MLLRRVAVGLEIFRRTGQVLALQKWSPQGIEHNVFGEFVQNGMDREKLLRRSLCERIVLLGNKLR